MMLMNDDYDAWGHNLNIGKRNGVWHIIYKVVWLAPRLVLTLRLIWVHANAIHFLEGISLLIPFDLYDLELTDIQILNMIKVDRHSKSLLVTINKQ